MAKKISQLSSASTLNLTDEFEINQGGTSKKVSAATMGVLFGFGTYTNGAGITLTGNVFALDNSYFTGQATVAGGVVTLSNSAVIGKVLTGYVSGAGTVAATDTILQAIQKLNGNIAALVTGVSSVSGTSNRITASPTTGAVVVDISASYVGQSSITTLGTIGTGVWQGTAIADAYISSSTNWNTAYTNRITSLTVTGSSGAATLVSNVLNIPTYTLAGLGGTTLAAVNAQNLSVFAATTSAQLAGIISDETGSGVLVFGTSPTFTTSILVNGTITATAQNTTNTVNTLIVKDSSAANAFGIFNDGHMALGPTNPIAATFRISANHTGGATGTGIFLQGTIQTDVSTAMRMVLIQPTIDAGLALPTYSGVIIGTPGLGSGASNTTCNQLTIQELTSGAVGSGLIMQVASGTNKFNINATGTALNFLQGDLGIGDSGGTSRFIVTGNKSSTAWGTAGIQANFKASSYTDTSSSGTVAEVAITSHNIGTLVASSSTTYTNAYGTYLVAPGQGSNVTLTNTFALGILAGTSTIKLGQLTGDSTSSAIYMNQATPSAVNYTFNSDGSTLSVNGTTVRIKSANNSIVSFTATAATFSQVIKPVTGTTTIAPMQFISGTNLTTAIAGGMEYNNTFHLTNSDATRRHVVLAPNTTKVTAGAPYTNDGYVVMNIGGTDFKVMTTA